MDTNSLHEDSDSGHSWLTLDEELDKEDNDSEINALPSDGETGERREWMKERRSHSDRPKDAGLRPHADRPDDTDRRPLTDRLKDDARRPRSNRPKDGGRRSRPDRPKDDGRRPPTDRRKDDARRPPTDRRKDDARRPNTDRPKDDARRPPTDRPKVDARRPHTDRRKDDARRPNTDRPKDDARRPHSDRPKDEGRRSHPDRPNDGGKRPHTDRPFNDVRIPHPDRPKDDARRPHPDRPKYDGRRPHTGSPKDDGCRPRADRPKNDGRKPHTDRPKDDGRRSYSDRPKDAERRPYSDRQKGEGRRPHTDRPKGEGRSPHTHSSKDDGPSNGQELSQNMVPAPSLGGECEEPREWMKEQRSHVDRLKDGDRSNDNESSQNKVRVLLDHFRDCLKDGGRSNDQELSPNKVQVPLVIFRKLKEQKSVLQNPQARPSGVESEEPREWMKERRSYFDCLKDDGRNIDLELSLNKVQVPLVHFREPEEQKCVLQNPQALPSGVESTEPREWIKAQRSNFDCLKDDGRSNDQELSLNKVQVSLDHFRDTEEHKRVFQNPQALSSGGESEDRREWIKVQRSNFDYDERKNDQALPLNKLQVPIVNFRKLEEQKSVHQNPQVLPSGEEWMKEQRSFLDCLKDGGRSNDQELSLNKVQVPLDHLHDSEEQTRVFQNPQPLPSSVESEEPGEWMKDQRSNFDCLKDSGRSNDQELFLKKVQVSLDHFRDPEKETRQFQNPQPLPSDEEWREWMKERRSFFDCLKDGGHSNDPELYLKQVQAPLDNFRNSEEETRVFQNSLALPSGEERREWIKVQRSNVDCLKDDDRSNDQELPPNKVQVQLDHFRDLEEQTRVFQNPQALTSGVESEERREWMKEQRSLGANDNGRNNGQELSSKKVLVSVLDHFPYTEIQNKGESEVRREWMKEQISQFDRPNDDGRSNGLEISPKKVQAPVIDPFLDPEMQKRVFENFLRTVRRRAQYQKNLAGGTERNINSSEGTLNPQTSENLMKGLAGTQTAQISEAGVTRSEIPPLSTDSPGKPHPHQQTPFAIYLVPLTYPRDYLKQDQFESLSLQILSEIDDLPVGGKVAPKFHTAKLYHGSCLLNCADEETREWVLDLLPQLKAGPFELSSVTSTQLLHYVKAVAFIPGPPCASDLIIKRLWIQNPGLASDIWTVQQMTNNSEGSMVRLTFPETLVPALEKEKFKVCYGMDQIQLRLWKKKKSQPTKSAQEAKNILSHVRPVAGRSIGPNGENNCAFGYNELLKYEPGGRDEDSNSEGEQPMDLDD